MIGLWSQKGKRGSSNTMLYEFQKLEAESGFKTYSSNTMLYATRCGRTCK